MTATVQTQPQHRLTVGSISDQPLRSMLAGQQVDVLYCDPPWDDGHMKLFARGASKSTPVPVIPLPWTQFMRSLVEVIKSHVGGWVFVEMGNLHAPHAAIYLSEACPNVRRFDVVYGSPKKSSALLVGHRETGVADAWRMPAGAESGGLRMVKSIVASVGRPGQVLLDPCCGFGYSAKAALAAGMTFYGNELDSARANETRKLLER